MSDARSPHPNPLPNASLGEGVWRREVTARLAAAAAMIFTAAAMVIFRNYVAAAAAIFFLLLLQTFYSYRRDAEGAEKKQKF